MEKTQKQTTKKRPVGIGAGFAAAIKKMFLFSKSDAPGVMTMLPNYGVNQGRYWSTQQVKNAWRRKTQRYKVNNMKGGRK